MAEIALACICAKLHVMRRRTDAASELLMDNSAVTP